MNWNHICQLQISFPGCFPLPNIADLGAVMSGRVWGWAFGHNFLGCISVDQLVICKGTGGCDGVGLILKGEKFENRILVIPSFQYGI